MQRSWGKVIFSEECVKNSVHRRGRVWQGGVRGGGGWGCGRGHAWQGGMRGRGVCMAGGSCMAGGMLGKGACIAWGCAWWGHVWWEACMVACVVGACMAGGRAWQILRDTVNERAVRIILECILVVYILLVIAS